MKIYYNSNEEAEKQFNWIKTFIEEGINAHEWWQKYRFVDSEDLKHIPNITPENNDPPDSQPTNRIEFWIMFRSKFLNVYEYLGNLVYKDCNNSLAGNLNFGEPCDLENLVRDDNIILYSAECWHFANWQNFADFIKTKTNADKVAWVSEEDLDPFECI